MSTRTKGLRESSRSRASRGRARLGIRYVDDRILLTDNHAWAYYRIPSVSWEFTTPEEREALATNITVALAEPDTEVDLLGPEILGPDVLVGLFQVLPPARAPVRRRIQPGRPRMRRVRPVRDAQVNLGVGHPDRGQRDGDVRGQRLAFLRGGELPRDQRNPVVGPGMVVGEQDPVIEVPDA